ncbi:tRNA glutamyl-Q(34) synthetase GluQRS [Paracoccus fistulariae]|uniref:tRNA glutamyl-Q(34) synthetase GluQRS n=1 Tax=Paracoccus fistulariae TaxID=658446 RepID=A0ABY7SLJ5_9RHOB|nr:tRNA glutamyl-Q(34) synthetase GluQRS [Paracoccus fistulariae]MDB6179761.1 tRNA glutamyl-Q(34) synthetase GluQRS [Paracoccus fistulariae]WCR07873.1 tRNA glutamyl-Q(34) synthetase GluQRS [Paracoccus fistulariae]
MAGRAIRRTRFAPSPTGLLHLGHAYAALVAAEQADPGAFLLRIEDIDRERCRPDYEAAIHEDLHWLGLDWTQPALRQSDRMPAYQDALRRLEPLCYPCRCRRGDIRTALSAPQEGALPAGPDGLIYPGTCRHRSMTDLGADDVIRLDARRAFDAIGVAQLEFRDEIILPGQPHRISRDEFLDGIGDVILSRRGMGTSYHLAVVVDDSAQGISLVTRGKDLFDSTWIHVILQKLLQLPTPLYHHHRLIRDDAGKRLAKRDDARALRHYRQDGATPADIRQMLGFRPSDP